ncbi:MAG: C40 family peptidase [Alphaproteobacteria bacterium]|nr:C40 family peptidase [Alphaproteobacteria bacterium]
MADFDPRRTPARADLAAAHLRGQIEAPRYAEGALHQVTAAVAPLRAKPDIDAEQETQLLFGEVFTVYDEADGYAWGQSQLDGYVGYVDVEALSAPVVPATHKITALRTYVFSRASLKSAPHYLLSLNARVTPEAQEGRYVKLVRSGWVPAIHIAPLDHAEPDWVAVAERFLGSPYQWGGRESLGLDCSGLVQTALHAAGLACPRDSDMQERELGRAAAIDLDALQRGDLICWKGHIGVMLDGVRLLHANAHHMATAIEPVKEAVARIAQTAGPVTSVRRL